MVLSLVLALRLAQSCAPAVSPATLLSVSQAESHFDPLAIGINGRRHRTLHPATVAEALAQLNGLKARGANFDVGLAQINATNMPRLGLSLGDALDPCRNLTGEACVLSEGYVAAHRTLTDSQAALRSALSRYNTGDAERGLRNGYVARVYAAAEEVVPALELAPAPSDDGPRDDGPVKLQEAVETAVDEPKTVLDVFARKPSPSLVWSAAAPRSPREPDRQSQPPQPGDPS